jgi:hypothetical protein
MAHSSAMARFTLGAVRLAVAVAALATSSFAQNQGVNDAHTDNKKWLLCDADWIFTPYDVGPDFSVTLSFRQAALPGILVILTPGGQLVDAGGKRGAPVTAMTDSSGTAHFLGVQPGKYTAAAKNGLAFPSNEVTVHAGGDFESEITIEWPLDSVAVPVRTLHGKLIMAGEETDLNPPLRLATVKLVDLRSSRVIETQRTIEDGSYEFSTIEPGLYVVRITPPVKDKKTKSMSGDLAVELDPAAAESTIPELKVQQSDCAGVQLLRKVGKEWE